MAQVFVNNGAAELSTNVSTSALTINFTKASSTFPKSLSSGDYFVATLVSATDPDYNEIIKVTAVTTTTITIQRAQEGTAAKPFNAGDKVELRLTAQGLKNISDKLEALDQVDNTSDMDKPISTAQRAAIDLKADTESLGTAATRNVGTSNGQLMEVGAFGLGGLYLNQNLSTRSYLAYFTPGTLPTNYPEGQYPYGAMLSIAHGYSGDNVDIVFQHTTNSKILYRNSRNADWREIYHSGSSIPWSQITGAPVHASRWPTWSEVTSKPSLVETSRSISTGTGLSGGGNLSANRTLSIGSTYSPNTSRQLVAENLNDIQTPGFYHQTTNANATTARNYPEASAGALVVTNAAGVVQEYTCYLSRNKYYRGFYSTSWGAWKRVVVDTDSIAWSRLTGVPEHATRANTWAEVSSKPSTFTPSAHNHSWSNITSGVPATATRWPTWTEVTSKPTTFTPSAHTHTLAQINAGLATMTTTQGVGSFVFAFLGTNTSTINPNGTIAGSSLVPGGVGTLYNSTKGVYEGAFHGTGSLAGTWRCLGSVYRNGSGSFGSLFVRVS